MPYIVIRLNNKRRDFVTSIVLSDDTTIEQAMEITPAINVALHEIYQSGHGDQMHAEAEV